MVYWFDLVDYRLVKTFHVTASFGFKSLAVSYSKFLSLSPKNVCQLIIYYLSSIYPSRSIYLIYLLSISIHLSIYLNLSLISLSSAINLSVYHLSILSTKSVISWLVSICQSITSHCHSCSIILSVAFRANVDMSAKMTKPSISHGVTVLRVMLPKANHGAVKLVMKA